jgi:cytochrome c2
MRSLWNLRCALLCVAAATGSGSAFAADPAPAVCNLELGQQVYALCSACHALSPDEIQREGPQLRGIVGAKSAMAASFAYSPKLRASGWTWDAATLDRFLANPRRALPGTTMTFIGLKSAEERSAVICYLREQR